MRRSRMWVATGLVVVSAAMIAACSPSMNGSSSGGAASLGGAAAHDAGPAAEPGAVSAPIASGGVDSTSGGSGGKAVDTAVTLTSPALILTADLEVRVAKPADVATTAGRAEDIAAAAGGRTDADDQSSGQSATATLTLKVPPAGFTAVLRRLAALGTAQSQRQATQDVTTQLVDVTSRVASAQAAITQLNKLYAQATKVSDIIEIETTLAQREADLESLEAQRNALRTQTAFATITLDLTTTVTIVHHHHSTTGFVGGLRRGWDNFAHAASWLSGAAGAVLPFAVLIGLLAAAAEVLRRRLRRSAPGAAPSSPGVGQVE
jgi:hypothetical protein